MADNNKPDKKEEVIDNEAIQKLKEAKNSKNALTILENHNKEQQKLKDDYAREQARIEAENWKKYIDEYYSDDNKAKRAAADNAFAEAQQKANQLGPIEPLKGQQNIPVISSFTNYTTDLKNSDTNSGLQTTDLQNLHKSFLLHLQNGSTDTKEAQEVLTYYYNRFVSQTNNIKIGAGQLLVDTNKITNPESIDLSFTFPNWGYDDHINERNIWRRGIYSPSGEPGWFYFKIFFRFDTQFGLLGGLLNDETALNTTNSAGKFLYFANKTYPKSKLLQRYIALKKFASILSYISSQTPWFFKNVKGLDKATYTGTDFTKEKSIEIGTLQDAVDMRLSTLVELYKFACYDELNNREIIPENLRKFEMSILVYNTPIRFLHDSAIPMTNTGEYHGNEFKSVTNFLMGGAAHPMSFENTLSYKLYTFKNCEISLPELGGLNNGELNNESPFKIGEGNLKIIYDKCYVHTNNETMGMMFGPDGFYYNLFNVKDKYMMNGSNMNQLEPLIYSGSTENIELLEDRYKNLLNALKSNNTSEIYLSSDALSDVIFDLSNSKIKINHRNNIIQKLYNSSYTFKDVIKNDHTEYRDTSYNNAKEYVLDFTKQIPLNDLAYHNAHTAKRSEFQKQTLSSTWARSFEQQISQSNTYYSNDILDVHKAHTADRYNNDNLLKYISETSNINYNSNGDKKRKQSMDSLKEYNKSEFDQETNGDKIRKNTLYNIFNMT